MSRMMTSGPPQHGHGRERGLGAFGRRAAIIAGLGLCRRHVYSSRASGDVVSARVPLASSRMRMPWEPCGIRGSEGDDELAVESFITVLATPCTIVLHRKVTPGAVAGDQPAVGDGDTVGSCDSIGHTGLWPADWPLGIDQPIRLDVAVPMRRERLGVVRAALSPTNFQAAFLMGPISLSRNIRRTAREPSHAEEARPHRYHARRRARYAAGTDPCGRVG